MTKYDISTFTWYDPEPRAWKMAVSVSESGGFMFNDQLRKKLPECFRLCASPDKQVLCIVELAEGTITLPKSGRKNLPRLLRDIKAAGVILPARYVFRAEDGMLFGELEQPKSWVTNRKPVPKKSRRISASQEEHILEGLKHGKVC